jgi:beta-aspartyl-peptidase (threonine type)
MRAIVWWPYSHHAAAGAGEYFIRAGVAHEICARLRFTGDAAQEAADVVLAEMRALGGTGGVILVTPAGDAVYSFNTPGMYRGEASPAGRTVAIYGDE